VVAPKNFVARKVALAQEISVAQEIAVAEEIAVGQKLAASPKIVVALIDILSERLKTLGSRLACSAAQHRNAQLLFQLVADTMHVSDQRLLAFGIDFAAQLFD